MYTADSQRILMRTLRAVRMGLGMVLFGIALMAAACSSGPKAEAERYVDFLYANMPYPDQVARPDGYWRANVEKTLEVRDRMGWEIPEKVFRHFVVPIRVGGEPLDDFRTQYADSLCVRVAGMTMSEAALEINHWCYERVIFALCEGITLSPMQLVQLGTGRCTDESVLMVAALRAAGIPARMANAPRWSHYDGGHAWVEFWADGKWHFMGACEPAARIDIGWFNDVVTMTHDIFVFVFGRYRGAGDVIARASGVSKVNVVGNYAPVRRTTVKVVDADGRPVRGARVEYKVFNSGEFVTLMTRTSDWFGRVQSDTGFGDLVAWASKGDRFGIARIAGKKTRVALDHQTGDAFSIDIDIVQPPYNPLPGFATEPEREANDRRRAQDDVIRESRAALPNEVVSAFFAAHDDANARALAASLSEKDLKTTTLDVLEDAYFHIDGTFNPLRDCPRIEQEPLQPFFSLLGANLKLESREAVEEWVGKNIEIISWYNPYKLRMPPADVWRVRKTDRRSCDIFTVALCRAMGLEAELPFAVEATDAGNSRLELTYAGSFVPEYFRHVTLSRIEAGTAQVVPLCGSKDPVRWTEVFPAELEEGYYMLTTGLRLADYGVLSHASFFTVSSDSTMVVPLVLRDTGGRPYALGYIDSTPFIVRTERDYFLLAYLGDSESTSRVCISQLESFMPSLAAWGKPLLAIGAAASALPALEVYSDADGSILKDFVSKCRLPSDELPMVVVCDGWGKVVYVSQGENPSLAGELENVITQL